VYVYPTDTVYGIGCGIGDGAGIEMLDHAKSRAPGSPFSMAVDGPETLWALAAPPIIPGLSSLLPGPVTLILDHSPDITPPLHPSLHLENRTGFRMPGTPLARSLLRVTGPLVSTSANPRGAPPPSTFPEAWSFATSLQKADPRIHLVGLDGGYLGPGVASTLIDGSSGKILRKGSVTEDMVSRLM